MNDFNSEIVLILILTLITIALAVYTLIGARWWLKNKDKFYKSYNGYFALPLWLMSIIAIIVIPALLLSYLMNDVKLVKSMGSGGKFIVFLAWLIPGTIYNLINLIRKSRSK